MTDQVSSNSIHTGKVWFITGTSTGFGRLLTEEVLKAGGKVLATARRPEQIADLTKKYPEAARTFALDVTNPEQIKRVAEQAIAAFGRIDVLVNNAGYGLAGGIEAATEAEFMPMFETNVFGLIRVTRAFLPQFRKQRAGHIINLSSMAGLVGNPGWGYYNATKFAVEGFSEALAGELAPLGVHVTIIEPGPFRTDFLGRSGVEAAQRIPDYEDTVGKTHTYFRENVGRQRGDPNKAVQAMMSIAGSTKPPLHLILGKIAYERFQTKLARWHDEMQEYEPMTLGADFPEGK
jgi:NAD(P)-dependent dehydrogenase (short-subunit alcohol dehydrogenase family)